MLYYSGNSVNLGRRAAGRRRIALGHFLFVGCAEGLPRDAVSQERSG